MASSATSKSHRFPVPPLTELVEILEHLQDELDRLIAVDITTIDSPEAMRDFHSSLKSCAKETLNASRNLSSRYNKIGSIEEAQNVRVQRSNNIKEVQEIVEGINVILSRSGNDILSNFDNSSVRSGYSLSSQLSAHSPTPRTSESHDSFQTIDNANCESPTPDNLLSQEPMMKQYEEKTPDGIGNTVSSPKTYVNNDSYDSSNNVKLVQTSSESFKLKPSSQTFVPKATQIQSLCSNKLPNSHNGSKNNVKFDLQPHYNETKSDSVVSHTSNPPLSPTRVDSKSLSYSTPEPITNMHAPNNPLGHENNSNFLFQKQESRFQIPSFINNKNSLPSQLSQSSPHPTPSFIHKARPQCQSHSHSGNYRPTSPLQHQPYPPQHQPYPPQHPPYPPQHPPHPQQHPPYPPQHQPYSPHHTSPPLTYQFQQLQLMSNHLLEQDLIKKAIEPFDGTPTRFWSWIGQLDSYIGSLDLTPFKTLQLIASYCTGEPQKMITRHLSAVQVVTQEDITEVWECLVERFGSSQGITRDLLNKAKSFPQIQGSNQGDQLHNLHDMCKVILHNQPRCPDLQQMNYASGLEELRKKLPEYIQREWRKTGQTFEDQNGYHPPFSVFVSFIKRQAKLQSNQNYETIFNKSVTPRTSTTQNNRQNIRALHTNTSDTSVVGPTSTTSTTTTHAPTNNTSQTQSPITPTTSTAKHCLYHDNKGHTIVECNAFKKLSYADKSKFAFNWRLCYKCLQSSHRATECNLKELCETCNKQHLTIMHGYIPRSSKDKPANEQETSTSKVLCTKVCANGNTKNCSTTYLVDITMPDVSTKKLRAYCIIDLQSNCTLVDEKVVNFFGKSFPQREFSLKFASQNCEMQSVGSVVTGLRVRGALQSENINLPEALSVPNLCDTKDDVATRTIVKQHDDVKHYAPFFPELDQEAEVLLLVGRDCGRAMASEVLNSSEPYVHKCPLGYSLVGNVCLNNPTKNSCNIRTQYETLNVKYEFTPKLQKDNFNIFESQPDDEFPGLSANDSKFIDIMESGVKITDAGSIELPLPLNGKSLPDNKCAVYMRTKKTLANLKLQPDKLEACLKSMSKSLSAGYVEKVDPALPEPRPGERWYLPIFCVQQAKKSKVRLVYDASARYEGVSLNDALLQGPDFNNLLRGVLTRFREKPIAFGADVEAMFNNYKVPLDQRDYLRFFWYGDNDDSNEITTYRSTSHIFGCASSPAVAAYGLKYSVQSAVDAPEEVLHYVNRSFYVDDGVYSVGSPDEAIKILSSTITILKGFNTRLHKITSNSQEVLDHFPESEIAATTSLLPTNTSTQCHRTLGVNWDTKDDTLNITTDIPSKPFTKRGILSVINSIYDPVGLVCPVILQGRLLQREFLPAKGHSEEIASLGWDEPLPPELFSSWNNWLMSLTDINLIKAPRSLYPLNFKIASQELHVFSDASEEAIGFVIYMRSIDKDENVHVSFVTASSKVAPKSATSIPRLELCAAAEAARGTACLLSEMDNKPTNIHMYTDSLITLGYLNNTTKRFRKYVERRVKDTLKHTQREDWHYVNTTQNPADLTTRPQTPKDLISSFWFTGPSFLTNMSLSPSVPPDVYPDLPEEKPAVTVLRCHEESSKSCIAELFTKCSSFVKLTNIVVNILKFIRKLDPVRQRLSTPLAPRSPTVTRQEAELFIVREAQRESYHQELKALTSQKPLNESSKIANLSPFMDTDEIIRVGGRIKRSDLSTNFKHPVLIPAAHKLSTLLIRKFHIDIKHQGAHISHGAIINAGFHIENGRQLIRKLITECVFCRKTRTPTSVQFMADLPTDRMETTPIFTNVGTDIFGPFNVSNGVNTRKSTSTKKIWVVIFVCMPSRAIHLEPLDSLDTSHYRNALSRFVALRGNCRVIRSDQGTNLMATKKQLESIDLAQISSELDVKGIKWIVNPPGASHHGGSWERKIGSVRRVLEASISLISNRTLSRDEFTTLLAEASSIVNSTPFSALSNDPDDLNPLSPSTLLTLKDTNEAPLLDHYSEQDILAYGKKRYRRVQYLAEQFWTRWRTDYLQNLNKRQKWLTPRRNFTEGDIVLLRDKGLPRSQWLMARVMSVKLSEDGFVRTVTLILPPLPGKAKTRVTSRSIADLVLLVPSTNTTFNP